LHKPEEYSIAESSTKKRIIVVSENLAAPWDEGSGQFASSVGRALAKHHDVRLIAVDGNGTAGAEEIIRRVPRSRLFLSPALRREIATFSPDAVLYVPSPSSTMASFVRAFSLRRHAPHAAHGMIALTPRRHRALVRPLLRGLAPDVLFVLSYRSLLDTHPLGLAACLVPVGFDPAVYRPPRGGERDALRASLGIERGSYVCLHVGQVRARRNLERLMDVAGRPGASVVVVAGERPADGQLLSRLEKAGVRVVRGAVPVEEYHRVADCYVYPVDDHGDEIDLPLGVFEALASGVPVVSTPYGGLRDFLPPGDDLRYVENGDEVLAAVTMLREHAAPVVRAMDDFSWGRSARRVVEALGQ